MAEQRNASGAPGRRDHAHLRAPTRTAASGEKPLFSRASISRTSSGLRSGPADHGPRTGALRPSGCAHAVDASPGRPRPDCLWPCRASAMNRRSRGGRAPDATPSPDDARGLASTAPTAWRCSSSHRRHKRSPQLKDRRVQPVVGVAQLGDGAGRRPPGRRLEDPPPGQGHARPSVSATSASEASASGAAPAARRRTDRR